MLCIGAQRVCIKGPFISPAQKSLELVRRKERQRRAPSRRRHNPGEPMHQGLQRTLHRLEQRVRAQTCDVRFTIRRRD